MRPNPTKITITRAMRYRVLREKPPFIKHRVRTLSSPRFHSHQQQRWCRGSLIASAIAMLPNPTSTGLLRPLVYFLFVLFICFVFPPLLIVVFFITIIILISIIFLQLSSKFDFVVVVWCFYYFFFKWVCLRWEVGVPDH